MSSSATTTMVTIWATATVLDAAMAATMYTVGAPDGLWDLQTDYAAWVKTKTFHPGDTITFTYSPELHDVVEVGEAGYDACSSANNISAFRTGNDAVALDAVGTRYFLCGLTGHCESGMKIRVDVVAATAAQQGPAPGPAASSAAAAHGSPSSLAAGAAAAFFLLQLQNGGIIRPRLPVW